MTNKDTITPAEIVAFWRSAGPERWFKKDDAFDIDIRSRYLATWQDAAAGALSSWEATDEGTLALIIVLDQFPRNMFRNDARAFASDALALATAKRAIERGVDQRVDAELRQFIYMPLMHAETIADQDRCVALFEALGNENNLKFAHIHADIIRRFGRFPHRNAVLGRDTTKNEQDFLDSGGFSG
jgi:uncharacterized protein (DUF924 family)